MSGFGNLTIRDTTDIFDVPGFQFGGVKTLEQTLKAATPTIEEKKTSAFSRLVSGEQVFKTTQPRTIEPILKPIRYYGSPTSTTDFVGNVLLGLPESLLKTLPITRLLYEKAPASTAERAKIIGNELIDYGRGLGQLVARPIVSTVSLFKNEPIEDQIKKVPFLGEVPTYERTAYEMLMAEVSLA